MREHDYKCIISSVSTAINQSAITALQNHYKIRIEIIAPEVELIIDYIVSNNVDIIIIDSQLLSKLYKRLNRLSKKFVIVLIISDNFLGYTKYINIFSFIEIPVNIRYIKHLLENIIKVLKFDEFFSIKLKTITDCLNESDTIIDDNFILIRHDNDTIAINYNEIIYFQGWDRYTKIFTKDNRVYLSSYSIGKWHSKLNKFYFVRCHKSYIVNGQVLNSINLTNLSINVNGIFIPISVRKKREVLNWMNREMKSY